MANPSATLASLGVAHGSLVYLRYPGGRLVTPTPSPAGPAGAGAVARPFGSHMTVAQMVAKQTRLERQEAPDCSSLSLDGAAAHAFQHYVSAALHFGVQRAGDLYGTVGEDGSVVAHAVYEPPQEGRVDGVDLRRDAAEEGRVAAVAAGLGLAKVGWVFSASTAVARDAALTSAEVLAVAREQAGGGPTFVTAVVSVVADEEGVTSCVPCGGRASARARDTALPTLMRTDFSLPLSPSVPPLYFSF